MIPVLLVIMYIVMNLIVVVTYPNQYKVIKTMGKISRVEKEEGLSFKVPVIQNVTTISKARHLHDIAPTEIYTADKKKMEVDAYVVWRVVDPIKFTKTLNSSKKNAENKISAMAYGALKAVVSATTQDKLIESRDAALEKEDVEDTLTDLEVQDITEFHEDPVEPEVEETEEEKSTPLSTKILNQLEDDYNPEQFGIEVQMVSIKILDLPGENKKAVYDRMKTERENIAAAYRAQGDSEGKKIRNLTDKETGVMISEETAKAAKIKAEGEAEYMRILSDAYNDPDKAEFYLFVRQLDAAKKSLVNGNTTLFLDSDSPLASLFEVN